MGADRSGLATAVALAGGVGDLGLDGGSQVELFEPSQPLIVSPAKGRSGPQGGRPRGARNRSTEEWREYLLGRYASPLQGLLELAQRSPEELARELSLFRKGKVFVPGPTGHEDGAWVEREDPDQLDLERAIKLQMEAMQAALPYLHQKQPIAVETNGKVAGMIVIGDMQGLQQAGEGMLTLDVEYQRVSKPEPQQSDEAKSETEQHQQDEPEHD